MHNEYDVLDIPGGGKLFMSNLRCATFKRERAGYTSICLEGREQGVQGKRFAHQGYTSQEEKAEGICVLWVTTGAVSRNFNREHYGG